VVKTLRDQPLPKPLPSSEFRQPVNRGSNRQLNSMSSRHHGRKARNKDPRRGEQHKNPIVVTGKNRKKMRNEAGVAIINAEYPCGH
jgi:ribosome assembly protein YihI (activator of Der GTPase)